MSPERRWRLLLVGLFAGSAVMTSASASDGGWVGTAVQLALCLLLAWRIAGVRLEAGPAGLTDVGLLRRRELPWAGVAGFDVARPGGLWGGFNVRAVAPDGSRTDLLSTRAYSRIPSARSVERLSEMAALLEDVRRTNTGS